MNKYKVNGPKTKPRLISANDGNKIIALINGCGKYRAVKNKAVLITVPTNNCGWPREKGIKKAPKGIAKCKTTFWREVKLMGRQKLFNQTSIIHGYYNKF